MQASAKPKTDDLPLRAGRVLSQLRAARPKVHCVTNTVAQAFTANVLLAAGALPSMTTAPEEIAAFATSADALLINLGTFDSERREAVDLALAARKDDRPLWVLDPVLVDRSPMRSAYARSLLARGPAAVRLNEAEFRALAGTDDDLSLYASRHGTVLAQTGTADTVTDGVRAIRIANGHALMARVTAMGCAESALVAACLAVEPDAFLAAASALLLLGIAGEIAGEAAAGPGSFAVAILDALDRLDGDIVASRARIS